MFLQIRVERVDGRPHLLKLKPDAQDLDPQVIFFVHHHDAGLIFVNDNPRPRLGMAKFTADQVAFDQNLFLQLIEGFHGNGQAAFHLRQRGNRLHTLLADLAFLRVLGPTGERMFA